MDQANNPALRIEIKNRRLVELNDFTASMHSLADEYERFAETHDLDASAGEVRLYIQRLETGSIIAELVPLAPFVLPLMSEVNTVGGFFKYLKAAYDYLTGKSAEKPPLERSSFQNLSNIVEPVAKDQGSQFNVGTINVAGPLILTLDASQANAAQNVAKREIALLQAPSRGLHEKVLLYWFQARNQPHPKAGDKGVIESISTAPVNVVFTDDGIKMQMIGGEENIFRRAYVVDVVVETIQGKPALYKVLALHESIER